MKTSASGVFCRIKSVYIPQYKEKRIPNKNNRNAYDNVISCKSIELRNTNKRETKDLSYMGLFSSICFYSPSHICVVSFFPKQINIYLFLFSHKRQNFSNIVRYLNNQFSLV